MDFNLHLCRRKAAFTLAEVLITLGIIGVVAAMTLPGLIADHRIKVLEAQFKKTSSNIENALNLATQDLGLQSIDDLTNICGSRVWKSENGNLMVDADNPKTQAYRECRTKIQNEYLPKLHEAFLAHLGVVQRFEDGTPELTKLANQHPVYNYNGTRNGNGSYFALYGVSNFNTPTTAGVYILNDGSMVSGMTFLYHEEGDGLNFSFDTNGPYKGPNRFGYDIFLYTAGNTTWGKWCGGAYAGSVFGYRDCYKYAILDKNPDDNTKRYWKSLKL